MFVGRDPPDGLNECFPPLTLGCEHFATFGREAVETSTTLTASLDPSPGNPTAPFKPVQQGVHGGSFEAQRSFGALLNQLTQVVPMARPALQQRQNQQFGTSLLQLTVEHARQFIFHCDILLKGICRVNVRRTAFAFQLDTEGQPSMKKSQ
jgi:hypothetical protein